jgi:hypothetical protein
MEMAVHRDTPPNYYALDEAVNAHPEIRAAAIFLAVVIIGVIQAVRWISQFTPAAGI